MHRSHTHLLGTGCRDMEVSWGLKNNDSGENRNPD